MQTEHLVYKALADTFVCDLNDQEIDEIDTEYTQLVDPRLQVPRELRLQFYKYKPSDHVEIGKLCFDLLDRIVPKDKMFKLVQVLKLMNTTLGTFLIFGSRKALAPFPDIAREEREELLNNLKLAWLSEVRQLFRVFNGVSALYSYGISIENPPHFPALKVESFENRQVIPDNETFLPKFIDIKKISRENKATLRCDIVVVGSGCGGSVVAKELSEQGYDVILVDKGDYFMPSERFQHEKDAMNALYESSCALYSEDLSMQILAGSTFGGGSVVNW